MMFNRYLDQDLVGQHCMDTHMHDDWIAYMDPDEYISLPSTEVANTVANTVTGKYTYSLNSIIYSTHYV